MSATLPTMPPGFAAGGSPNETTQPTGRGRLFTLIFGVVAVVVTVAAILLAVIAPALSTAPPAPGAWTRVFDADLASAGSVVSTGQGCQVTSSGLEVTGSQKFGYACAINFGTANPLANGFLMTMTLAPNGQISSGGEQPYIALGDSVEVHVEEPATDSIFVICRPDCAADPRPVTLSSDAWHNDAFYANTLTFYWTGSGQQLVVYANGQQVAAIAFAFQGNTALTLGAIAQGEAVYTHLTVYTP